MPTINDLTTGELVTGYNVLTGSGVKRFTSRAVGIERIIKAATAQGKTEANIVALVRPAPAEVFDLTENELHALYFLTLDALAGCGGERPSFFEMDEYTWCDTGSLVDRGWSKESANGTFGSLVEKRCIDEIEKGEWAINRKAWCWLDTKWDALHSSVPNWTEIEAVEPSVVPAPKKAKVEDGPAYSKVATGSEIKLPRASSKRAKLLDALRRKGGVTLGELKEITGWRAIPRVTATRTAAQAGYRIAKTGEGLAQVWRAV
ncbi:hypothetical protein T8K17_13415 [Thalassobaculum sp. OXR-137]|uniref:hypothetical protein n=1 Tax=Thalassobaculum sp. OXR-137 TaxID=3100173 RepID=UPI002AC8E4CA|nr:hypothetical protein [Thalassobaculum sp. OXR-137]WPZ32241.1 hypothetical protein T8K17_13415 [Thalassobaculum sp. OXR-137]